MKKETFPDKSYNKNCKSMNSSHHFTFRIHISVGSMIINFNFFFFLSLNKNAWESEFTYFEVCYN